MRADAGYFAGQLAQAAHDAKIAFAIGAKRIAPLWRLLAGIAEDDWRDTIDMDGAQVAVTTRRGQRDFESRVRVGQRTSRRAGLPGFNGLGCSFPDG